MPDETKEVRFIRVAEGRVNSILDRIRLLKQASNRNNYAYSDAQIQKMFKVIRASLRDAEHSTRLPERLRRSSNFRRSGVGVVNRLAHRRASGKE